MSDLLARALAHAAAEPSSNANALGTVPPAWVASGPPTQTKWGIWVVHLRQTHGGVPVLGAVRSVRFDTLERITDFTGRTVPVAPAVPLHPVLDATSAVHASSLHLANELSAERPDIKDAVSNVQPQVTYCGLGPEATTTFRNAPFRDPIVASLAVKGDGSQLVWVVRFHLRGRGGAWTVLVDAVHEEPQIVEAMRTGAHAVSGSVFLHDPSLRREVVPFSDNWCNGNQLVGQNARCKDVRRRSLTATADGNSLRFEPKDASGLHQAMVNAFYAVNYCHDFFVEIGFGRDAGNFEGDDPVRITVWDENHRDFAEFITRRDGHVSELNLAKWRERHAALDFGVVIHEYAHGVTNRIVGGPDVPDPFYHHQSQALAEGSSDYFAITIQNWLRREARQRETNVFGAWISGHPSLGLRNHSYDDPFAGTYGMLGTSGFETHHDAGQVWCKALLDFHGALSDEMGNDGDSYGWFLVMASLYLLHPGENGPTFLHARNAIFAQVRAAVENGWLPKSRRLNDRLWVGFHRRGMGPNAKSPRPDYGGIEEDLLTE